MSDDAAFDRLEQMLDLALAALREGDGEAALLALMEAEAAAESLPKKPAPPET